MDGEFGRNRGFGHGGSVSEGAAECGKIVPFVIGLTTMIAIGYCNSSWSLFTFGRNMSCYGGDGRMWVQSLASRRRAELAAPFHAPSDGG